MIFVAPKALAANKMFRPMGPAPKIKTFESALILPLLQACTAIDNGWSSAPSVKDTWSGSLDNFCKTTGLYCKKSYLYK